jgi:hypothetical protein
MKSIFAIVLGAGLIAGAASAQAMPLSPLAADNMVTHVAGGCGVGWHRGPYNGCRRNYAQPWKHACPRGWYPGPHGCRANGT